MNQNETISQNWQARRTAFNHDWLMSRFDRDIYAWVDVFNGEPEDELFNSESFAATFFKVWQDRHNDVCKLVSEYEYAMSPARLLDVPPLSNMSEDSREWLREFVHTLWKVRCDVDKQQSDALAAILSAAEVFSRIRTAYDAEGFKALIGSKEFVQELKELIERCKQLGNALSRLNREIEVI
jgi:hypothetical protein